MSFYKMYRGWMDNDVFAAEPFTEREAWEWMISEAAWQERQINLAGNPIVLQRGQFSHSQRHMADVFKWTRSKVRVFIDKLERFKMCIPHSSHAIAQGQAIVTICNYSIYQDQSSRNSPEDSPHSSHSTAQQQPNSKELKKVKKEEDSLEALTSPPQLLENKPEKKKGQRLQPWLDAFGEEAAGKELGTWALETLRLDVAVINTEMAKFCDYWNSMPGQKGVKLDWPATWRNWCRRVKEQQIKQEKQNELWRKR